VFDRIPIHFRYQSMLNECWIVGAGVIYPSPTAEIETFHIAEAGG
jgi:hypothetical protein